MSAEDAIRIASTEMEGASENENGILATQTACPALRYLESLLVSPGQEEGRKKTLKDLRVRSEDGADEITDRWVAMHGGWKKRKEG